MEEDRKKLEKLMLEAVYADETWSKTPVGYALLGIKDENGLLSNVDVTVISKQNLQDIMKEDFKFEYVREDRIPVISWA